MIGLQQRSFCVVAHAECLDLVDVKRAPQPSRTSSTLFSFLFCLAQTLPPEACALLRFNLTCVCHLKGRR